MIHWKTITAIGAITLLEAFALFTGHNGTMFTLSIATIAGLGGFQLKQTLDQLKQDNKE